MIKRFYSWWYSLKPIQLRLGSLEFFGMNYWCRFWKDDCGIHICILGIGVELLKEKGVDGFMSLDDLLS